MALATEKNRNEENDQVVPWYSAELQNLSLSARHLLEKYSNVPPDEVIPHILDIRDHAWSIWRYPCIGQFRFLDLSISLSPIYPLLLQRLHFGQTLLDLGCCFGQDIRKLVADGAPADNLIGADLHQDFLDLGYELFRDRGKLTSRFFAGDILADEPTFEELNGKLDIIHVASFFHLFSLPTQIQITKRLVKMLRPIPGSVIFGRQTGNVKAGEYQHGSQAQANMWRHNVSSWEELWATVSKETGTEWKVDARLESTDGFVRREGVEETQWRHEGDRSLMFEVWRL